MSYAVENELWGQQEMPHTTLNTYLTEARLARVEEIVASITALGHRVLRYGLALVISWIGMMKFTGYEAL